jgi:hypothetical protein
MFKWFSLLGAGWQWGLLAAISVFWLGVGIQGTRIVYQAAKVDDYETAIAARDAKILGLQAEVGKYSKDAEANAKEKAVKDAELKQQKENRDKTYENTPANTNACIAPIRVQFLNAGRATANSLRAR